MTTAFQTMKEVSDAYWKETEGERVLRARKLWDWYYNDRDEVSSDVQGALLKMFQQQTINRMNIRMMNIVRPVIDRIARLYKEQPARDLNGGRVSKIQGGSTVQIPNPQNDLYQSVISSSTLARSTGAIESMATLFNTVLVQPIWKYDRLGRGFFDFYVHTPAWTVVETDERDWLVPRAFYYPLNVEVDGDERQVLVYWSDTEHFWVDRLGNRMNAAGMTGQENPYGVLPVSVMRILPGTDFWGEGKWQLVEGNEEVCVQLTNLYNVAVFQAHGQAVAINMGLSGNPSLGPATLISAEKVGSDLQAADFKYVQPNAALEPVQGLIDWTIKTLQVVEGISGHSLAIDPAIQSGISKVQDAATMQEVREDLIPVATDFEYDLFRVMSRIYNYHNPGKKLDEDAEFRCSFAKPKVLKTVDEKVKEREMALKLGLASQVDFYMEDHPEYSREEAVERLKEIETESKMFKSQSPQ